MEISRLHITLQIINSQNDSKLENKIYFKINTINFDRTRVLFLALKHEIDLINKLLLLLDKFHHTSILALRLL